MLFDIFLAIGPLASHDEAELTLLENVATEALRRSDPCLLPTALRVAGLLPAARLCGLRESLIALLQSSRLEVVQAVLPLLEECYQKGNVSSGSRLGDMMVVKRLLESGPISEPVPGDRGETTAGVISLVGILAGTSADFGQKDLDGLFVLVTLAC